MKNDQLIYFARFLGGKLEIDIIHAASKLRQLELLPNCWFFGASISHLNKTVCHTWSDVQVIMLYKRIYPKLLNTDKVLPSNRKLRTKTIV